LFLKVSNGTARARPADQETSGTRAEIFIEGFCRMTNGEWESARQAACQAAAEAWRAIAGLYETGSHVTEKPEGPSTEADRLADRLIVEHLKRNFPPDKYGYLTEESEDDNQRLERDRVWVIDPIDGTIDFIKKNGNFTIHVGFVEKTAPGRWDVVASAVYRPVPGDMFSAVKGGGSWVQPYENHQPVGERKRISVSSRATIDQMCAVISSSHRTGQLDRLIRFMGCADYLSIGSIGLKLSLIATGRCDFYVNLARGKCKEWDACAPDLILSEAGGILTDLNGDRFIYNQQNTTVVHGMLASNSPAHQELLKRVAQFEQAEAAAKA
jgi:3'(2'), 5'-bisphosphate nucleotidase